MYINNFDPVALSFFGIDIRWYSLSYIFGIILGWIFLKKKYLKDNIEINKLFDEYISYIIFGIIIGGRLGYVFIYNLHYFINNPLKILYIWEGGMSFHGGVIGIIVSSYLFAKKFNKDILFF